MADHIEINALHAENVQGAMRAAEAAAVVEVYTLDGEKIASGLPQEGAVEAARRLAEARGDGRVVLYDPVRDWLYVYADKHSLPVRQSWHDRWGWPWTSEGDCPISPKSVC